MGSNALEFEDVCFSYRNGAKATEAVRSLSFQVGSGEIVGLVGPSGCGKSTILKLAADLVPAPNRGRISVAGVPPAEARRGRRIAMLFQTPVLLPWRNVIDNVLLPAQIAHGAKAESITKAEALLELAGMTGFSTFPIHELSGGMQQRVSLVRCLMSSPQILLLDEPFTSLDELLKEELLGLMQQVAQRLSLTILHVSHSLEESALLCDKVAVLQPRPTSVAEVISVPLDRPRVFPHRVQPGFLAVLSRLRESLRASCEPQKGDEGR